MKSTATRLVAWLAFAAVSAVLIPAAFLWGNHLLGLESGILYVVVTAGLLWLFARSFATPGRPSLWRAAAILAVSLPVGFVMADPAAVNPDVRHFIDKQATDRAARQELGAVFASDPAYGDLSISTTHLKAVNVTIRGSLNGRPDLDRLRARIVGECPVVDRCALHWDVTLRESGQRIDGLDSELFRAGR